MISDYTVTVICDYCRLSSTNLEFPKAPDEKKIKEELESLDWHVINKNRHMCNTCRRSHV